jgi:hypothetical protein
MMKQLIPEVHRIALVPVPMCEEQRDLKTLAASRAQLTWQRRMTRRHGPNPLCSGATRLMSYGWLSSTRTRKAVIAARKVKLVEVTTERPPAAAVVVEEAGVQPP